MRALLGPLSRQGLRFPMRRHNARKVSANNYQDRHPGPAQHGEPVVSLMTACHDRLTPRNGCLSLPELGKGNRPGGVQMSAHTGGKGRGDFGG